MIYKKDSELYIKAKDFKVLGAKKTITTGISRGTVVVKGNPGKTYTIKYGGAVQDIGFLILVNRRFRLIT